VGGGLDWGAEQPAPSGVPLDYSRAGLSVSLQARHSAFRMKRIAAILACAAAFAASALAQYPGRISKTDDKKKPVLRSVAVLEWTGSPGKPSASRLVPVAVYDGEQLNDGTIYLPQPYPLAVSNGIEYELQTAGKPIGLFDLLGVGKEDGEWEAFGAWKPLTAPEAKKAENAFNSSSLKNGGFGDADDDTPVLKRKHPKGTDTDDGSSSGGSGNSSKPAASSGSGSGSASADPDRPTLHRKTGDDSGSSGSGAGTASADPDRPTLHRSKHTDDADGGAGTGTPDPDRPRLKHGKPAGEDDAEIPMLKGFPPSMQQAVAVSDAYDHAEHPWKYSWANPDDEAKMKTALEAIARKELGLDIPAKPTKAPAKTAKTGVRTKTPLVPLTPPEPAPLAEEQFRVFELAYGSSATLVLTASTPLPPGSAADSSSSSGGSDDSSEPPPPVIKRGKPTASSNAPAPPASTPAAPKAAPKPAPQKFVTIIAQPDLYGGILVLYKTATDAARLDDKPRMRLVDAVDAMADNRGELLFELRGQTQRQFALYRVLRGSAEQLFATVAMP
jgi:hypothetical protein